MKITMPSPLTVGDTIVDDHYGDLHALGRAIAEALNQKVLGLAEAGCWHIQIEEPLFVRYPEHDLALQKLCNLSKASHSLP